MATIISEDTTWSGVMSISDDVQVAEGGYFNHFSRI